VSHIQHDISKGTVALRVAVAKKNGIPKDAVLVCRLLDDFSLP
jgi:hypothetical protein